jgi:hypothetical protein
MVAPLIYLGYLGGSLAFRGLAALAARRVAARLAATTVAGAALTAGGLTIASLTGGTKTDPYKDNIVGFPQDLDAIGHYIEFVAEETKGIATGGIEAVAAGLSGGQVSIVGTKINGATIRLPMPANLSVDYNPTYTSSDLGNGPGGILLKAGDRAIYGNTDIPLSAMSGGALAAVGVGIVKAVGGAVGLSAGEGDGPGVGAAVLKVGAGVAQNPHKIVLFTGVNFREHTFSWKLSPRNRRESDLIRTIINMFTFYSHPEYVAGGLFFKYPEFFKIRFRHPEYLFELRPAVCTNVKVDFHSQGTPAYVRLSDGSGPPAPAEITLSLTFKETEIITKDFLNKERITIGPSPPAGGYQMPAVDILGNPLGNGLDVNGDPMR